MLVLLLLIYQHRVFNTHTHRHTPYRPQNGPDRYLTRNNRCNLYLTDALGSQIVEILTLRVQYVTTLLRNRRNPQLTRSLLISARAKKVVPARLLNLGR